MDNQKIYKTLEIIVKAVFLWIVQKLMLIISNGAI